MVESKAQVNILKEKIIIRPNLIRDNYEFLVSYEISLMFKSGEVPP